MGNLEKYGVLALIFVIVLILTVAIWNGPAPKQPTEVAKLDPSAPRVENPPAPGPAAQPTAPPQTPPANVANVPSNAIEAKPQFRTYTVEKNDSLASIAKKMLGSSARWTEIAKANEGLDPKKLRIGQSILVPSGDEDPKAEPKEEPKAAKGRAKSSKLASR